MVDDTLAVRAWKLPAIIFALLLLQNCTPLCALAEKSANQKPQPAKTTGANSKVNGSAKSGAGDRPNAKPSDHYLRQLEFEVLGSSCYACIRKVEMDLRALPGVEVAKASNLKQPPVVTVIYDMDKTKPALLIKNVQDGGYTVRNQRDSFFKIARDPDSGKSKPMLYDLPGLRPGE